MARDLPIGNGSLLVAFDADYRVRDLFFLHVEAVAVSEHAGVVHRLCSEACKAKFDREPAKYVTRQAGS
jgi:YHS domain-containing protein